MHPIPNNREARSEIVVMIKQKIGEPFQENGKRIGLNHITGFPVHLYFGI